MFSSNSMVNPPENTPYKGAVPLDLEDTIQDLLDNHVPQETPGMNIIDVVCVDGKRISIRGKRTGSHNSIRYFLDYQRFTAIDERPTRVDHEVGEDLFKVVRSEAYAFNNEQNNVTKLDAGVTIGAPIAAGVVGALTPVTYGLALVGAATVLGVYYLTRSAISFHKKRCMNAIAAEYDQDVETLREKNIESAQKLVDDKVGFYQGGLDEVQERFLGQPLSFISLPSATQFLIAQNRFQLGVQAYKLGAKAVIHCQLGELATGTPVTFAD